MEKIGNDTFKYNGKTYKLVRKPDSFGCTEICPLALANKGNCEALCSEAFLDIESPEFKYVNCIFVEVTETENENKETTMEEKEPNYKALYEQEHKKYGDAVERMKSWMNGEHPECFSEAQKAAEFVFPELAESEEEKLSKKLHECVCRAINNDKLPYEERKYISLQVIPYLENLEKQKEPKPQSKQEWREEDEKIRKEIIDYLKGFIPHHDDDLVAKSRIWIDWLENLEKQKEQKATWSGEDAEMLICHRIC